MKKSYQWGVIIKPVNLIKSKKSFQQLLNEFLKEKMDEALKDLTKGY